MKRITANQYQTSERYYKLPKILFENEEDRNTQPILKRKVEKVTFLIIFNLALLVLAGWAGHKWKKG